jgi:hypothetical protein
MQFCDRRLFLEHELVSAKGKKNMANNTFNYVLKFGDSVFHFLTGPTLPSYSFNGSPWSSYGKINFTRRDISTTAGPIATKFQGLIVLYRSIDCRCLEDSISNHVRAISGQIKDFDLDILKNGLPNDDEIRGLNAAADLYQVLEA